LTRGLSVKATDITRKYLNRSVDRLRSLPIENDKVGGTTDGE
jgi:hypothetical protein